MANGTAPFCPTTRSPPVRPTQLGVDVNAIAPATDLKSAISALNRMNNVVQHITRGQPQINNVHPGAATAPQEPQYPRVVWEQMGHDYNLQRVVNPDDRDQSIEIHSICNIKWLETGFLHSLVYVGYQ